MTTSLPTQRTWEENAAEFGALTKQGKDIRLSLLVACSVKRGQAGRISEKNRRDHANTSEGKTSAREFVKETKVKTTHDRILRHLDAWTALADLGHVPQADTLTPPDAMTLDISEEAERLFKAPRWNPDGTPGEGVFDATNAGGRPRDNTPEAAAKIIRSKGAEAVVAELTDDEVEEIVETAHRKRKIPAQRGVSRSYDLPLSPTGGKIPDAVPGHAAATLHMDLDAEIARLHDAILRVDRIVRENPGQTVAARSTRIQQEAEQLRIVGELAQGLTDTDISDLLEGSR